MDANATSDFRGRRPKGSGARSDTLGTAVTKAELAETKEAMQAGGFASPADGLRKIVFAYNRCTKVRDAVAQAVRELKIA